MDFSERPFTSIWLSNFPGKNQSETVCQRTPDQHISIGLPLRRPLTANGWIQITVDISNWSARSTNDCSSIFAKSKLMRWNDIWES